ncbi:DUF3265 domain-containing protein [Vibrio vulnificus]|nr:DUF3265 domain-containing protein [Vibrio vulnificus]
MTKRLSGIWHAWHFRFALGSVIKSLCGSFCIACLHPLTRRYGFFQKLYWLDEQCLLFVFYSLCKVLFLL